jgi:signal transduction histidine kinase
MMTSCPALPGEALPIDPVMADKWQHVLDLLARMLRVPAALIMRVAPPNIQVFLSSHSPGNPYEEHELAPLQTGLYCETVMAQRGELLVPDALRDKDWCHNPDIKLGMISYLGLPLIWPDDQVFGTICVLDRKENAYDLTQRQLLEQFRGLVERDLRQVYEQREQALRDAAVLDQMIASAKLASIGRLVSGLAHELNTPLGNILLGSSSLSARLDDISQQAEARTLSQSGLRRLLDEGRQACATIERNSTRAGQLLASVKQIAVDQDGQQRRHFALDETVAHVVSATGPLMRREAINLTLDIPPGLSMDSYPGHIEQILVSLLDNSARHAFAGQAAREVRIVAALRGEEVELVYTDNGCGITAEALPRVFDPFYTTRIGEGARGLGLAVVLNAVQSILKGSVHLDSAPGAGVRFTFRLPLNPSAR